MDTVVISDEEEEVHPEGYGRSCVTEARDEGERIQSIEQMRNDEEEVRVNNAFEEEDTVREVEAHGDDKNDRWKAASIHRKRRVLDVAKKTLCGENTACPRWV